MFFKSQRFVCSAVVVLFVLILLPESYAQTSGHFYSYRTNSPVILRYDGGTGALLDSIDLSGELGADARFLNIEASFNSPNVNLTARVTGASTVDFVRFNTHTNTVSSVTEVPANGPLVSSAVSNAIFGVDFRYDPDTGETFSTGYYDEFDGAVYTYGMLQAAPRGGYLIGEAVVTLWDLRGGALFDENLEPAAYSSSIRDDYKFNKAGELFHISGGGGLNKVRLYDDQVNEFIAHIDDLPRFRDFVLGRNGNVYLDQGTTVFEYDLETSQLTEFAELSDRGQIAFQSNVSELLFGDCNQDGVVNFFDIVPFISILSDADYLAEADIDQNGVVDFLDIQHFIALLSS